MCISSVYINSSLGGKGLGWGDMERWREGGGERWKKEGGEGAERWREGGGEGVER